MNSSRHFIPEVLFAFVEKSFHPSKSKLTFGISTVKIEDQMLPSAYIRKLKSQSSASPFGVEIQYQKTSPHYNFP